VLVLLLGIGLCSWFGYPFDPIHFSLFQLLADTFPDNSQEEKSLEVFQSLLPVVIFQRCDYFRHVAGQHLVEAVER